MEQITGLVLKIISNAGDLSVTEVSVILILLCSVAIVCYMWYSTNLFSKRFELSDLRFVNTDKTILNIEKRQDAIESDNKEFKTSMTKIMEGMQKTQDKQQDTLQELTKVQNEMIPLIKNHNLRAANEARDKIRARGIEVWQKGNDILEQFITENHDHLFSNPAIYKKMLMDTGFNLLEKEHDESLKLSGSSGVKMSNAVNEKVFPNFKKDMDEYIDYLCNGKKLPQGWSRKLRDIFLSSMKEWEILFNTYWEDGLV